ncbi:MAG: hypothetical protein JXK07_03200, partial [Spirochaetes bacterium]|nr:hypothetical protein [Spirochaetota bacterium]
MKIVLVIGNSTFYSYFDRVVRCLSDQGHEIEVFYGPAKKKSFNEKVLQNTLNEVKNLKASPSLYRKNGSGMVDFIRELVNYCHQLNQDNHWNIKKWGRFFSPAMRTVLENRFVNRLLKNQTIQNILIKLDENVPVEKSIFCWMKENRPDIVIASPLLVPKAREIEYIRAAKALNIPTVYLLLSWDNLSTKATFHGQPDVAMVWNRSLASELSLLHRFPENNIIITGAPRFDVWFEKKPALDKAAFCRLAGFDKEEPYILYLGSSFLVKKDYSKEIDESYLIYDLADKLAQNSKTAHYKILVRPNPTNFWTAPSILNGSPKNVVLYPLEPQVPDTPENQSTFFHSLYYSSAVVGVNTTAFFEAAVLDKPCIGLCPEEYKPTRDGLAHSHHYELYDFLEEVHATSEVVDIL